MGDNDGGSQLLNRGGITDVLAVLATHKDPNEPAIAKLQLKGPIGVQGPEELGNTDIQEVIERVQMMLDEGEGGVRKQEFENMSRDIHCLVCE